MRGHNEYFYSQDDYNTNASIALDQALKSVPFFDPVRDQHHQMTLDMYSEAERYSLSQLLIKDRTLKITTTSSQEFELTGICRMANEGVVAHVLGDEDLWLIRGTMYTNSLMDNLDEYVRWQRDIFFSTPNLGAEEQISDSHTSPFVAAKGDIGQFGRLVFSRVLLEDKFHFLVGTNQLDVDDVEYGIRVKKDYGELNLVCLKGLENLSHCTFSMEWVS